MRDTYYQSVGNPIQRNLLPATEPETEMLPPSASLRACLAHVATTLATAGAAALAVLIFYRSPGVTWLEPYDLVFAIPVVVGGFCFWSFTGEGRWLIHPLFLAGVAILFLNHRVAWGYQILAASCAVSLLVYSFGRHWTVVCTANPTPRSTADALRTHWRLQLLATAALAGALTGIMLWSGIVLFKLALITLPFAAALAPAPAGLRSARWRVILESLLSWAAYQPSPLPGLLQSPVGPALHRRGLIVFAAVLAAAILVRWTGSPIPRVIEVARSQHLALDQQLDARGAGTFERVRYASLTWGAALLAIASLPIVLPLTMAVSFNLPLLLDAAAQRDQAQSTGNGVATTLADLRRSPDRTERESVYLGRVVEDSSPVLIPRDVFREHAHVLGDSGSGKTSKFLCPVTEQLAMVGDCSIVAVDLKSDTREILGTLLAVQEAVRRERGVTMPLKTFSNQAGMPTFAFNPTTQPYWTDFDLLTRTDILCAANGLTYGTDYGQGYYSSANAAVVYHALKTFPHVTSFKELATCIGNVIDTARKRELHPEIRKAGVHVLEVMKRLAACEPLNVTATTGHSPEVVEQAIDLTQVFREPQLLYFHLSATLSPSGAPEIARLVTYMLLAAATQTQRRHPVFLVIDEFQRMVASNLEYMLQLARSMGVGVILANQSMEDLKKSTTNLIPAIEANCRLRQWFSVSSSDDQQRLINSSGLTVDYVLGQSVSSGSDGRRTVSHSRTEKVVNRFTINDIALTSDHPSRSFLRISRGAGYAQYGGLPVIIESDYHISEEEYRRRKSLPWPAGPGTLVPSRKFVADSQPKASAKPAAPQFTEEVIGAPTAPLSPQEAHSIEDMFQQLQASMPAPKQPNRRRNRK